jgi:3-methyladenine DNA glycosylase AlkD
MGTIRIAIALDAATLIRRLRSVPANTVPLRNERKRISREIAPLDRSEVLRLAHDLLNARLPRFVAYELVLNHAPTLNTLTVAEVEALGEGLDSWGDIDSFACFVSGPAWRAGRLPDRLIRSWARSGDWCWQRVALVSTVPLRDSSRALDICRLVVDNRDDLVVKALSWTLRALSKYDPGAARQFLLDYRDRLAARVLREVNNKLTTGLKNPHHTPGIKR